MNLLQLYISKSGKAFKTLAEINASEETRRHLVDFSPIVGAVDYAPAHKSIFYAVSRIAEGCIVRIIRTIPPTAPHHLEAAVFVPNHVDITTDELADVISAVSQKVLASNITENDMNDLRELFSHQYDSDDDLDAAKPSHGTKLGFVGYDGDREFADCLDDVIWGNEYSDFKAVLLLERPLMPKDPATVIDIYAHDSAPEPIGQEAKRQKAPKSKGKAEKEEDRLMTYSFSLPMSTPEGRSAIEFEIQSVKAITRSPIHGYEIAGKISEGDGNVNRLRRSHGDGLYGRFGRWLFGIGGFALGLAVMWIIGLVSDGSTRSDVQDSHKIETRQQSTKPVATEATAYLDGKRVWRRDEMERIDGLAGLFDDLNNYRFEELTGRWASELAASQNFAKVAAAAGKATAKKIDPRRSDEHSPCYNREGDIAIGWLGYTYWIDP